MNPQALQGDVTASNQRIFDFYARDEALVFSSAMDKISETFELVLESRSNRGATDGEAAAFGIAGWSYQMLLGTWSELRSGRGASAVALFRGVYESCDYVVACLDDPSFMNEWRTFKGGKPARSATAAASRFLDRVSPGRGKIWRANREMIHRTFQAGPHVAHGNVSSVLLTGETGSTFVPEGAYSPALAANAFVAARLALDLLTIVDFAFATVLDPNRLAEVDEFIREGYERLNREFDARFGGAGGER